MATNIVDLQTRKQDFVRGAIWDAAVDLFVERGFDETTVEEIAQAAGVSRRTFFRYFGSKGDLMGQGILTYGSALSQAIEACSRSMPLFQVVRETVLNVASAIAIHPRVRQIMFVTAASTAAREAQLSRMAEAEDGVAQAFAHRCPDSSRDTLTPRLLARLTLSILDVTFRTWFEHENEDISVTAEKVCRRLGWIVSGSVPPDRSHERQRTQRPKTRPVRP